MYEIEWQLPPQICPAAVNRNGSWASPLPTCSHAQPRMEFLPTDCRQECCGLMPR